MKIRRYKYGVKIWSNATLYKSRVSDGTGDDGWMDEEGCGGWVSEMQSKELGIMKRRLFRSEDAMEDACEMEAHRVAG
jgi:hypothetical protein